MLTGPWSDPSPVLRRATICGSRVCTAGIVAADGSLTTIPAIVVLTGSWSDPASVPGDGSWVTILVTDRDAEPSLNYFPVI